MGPTSLEEHHVRKDDGRVSVKSPVEGGNDVRLEYED